jgi:hypothetical protein
MGPRSISRGNSAGATSLVVGRLPCCEIRPGGYRLGPTRRVKRRFCCQRATSGCERVSAAMLPPPRSHDCDVQMLHDVATSAARQVRSSDRANAIPGDPVGWTKVDDDHGVR